MFEIELFICVKIDLALNNLDGLICHKTQTKLSLSDCSTFHSHFVYLSFLSLVFCFLFPILAVFLLTMNSYFLTLFSHLFYFVFFFSFSSSSSQHLHICYLYNNNYFLSGLSFHYSLVPDFFFFVVVVESACHISMNALKKIMSHLTLHFFLLCKLTDQKANEIFIYDEYAH